MKKVALMIVMTLIFTSCTWSNSTPAEETVIPVVEVNTEVQIMNTHGDETETTNTWAEKTMEEKSTETSITEELSNGTEDEQLLNEVFNEINEVFELVEQNGGQ
jgi:hypothetical protein